MNKTPDFIFIHLPLDYLPEYGPKMVEYRVNGEILISARDLDSRPQERLKEIGRFLKDHQLSCTVHGPFLDLNPGSADDKIRQVSRDRFLQLMDLAPSLSPKVIVLHTAFNPLFYEDREESWLQASTETWLAVVRAAEKAKIKIAIENVLERTPDTIRELLSRIDSPFFGTCFDVGHFHLFSRVPLTDWITALGPRIFELHLHDNYGQRDEHLALGEGEIDIAALLDAVQEKGLSPALTIEAMDENQALLSLQRLSSYLSKE